MSRLIDSIRRLFARRRDDPENVERLRIEFRDRHHGFKLLLGANQKALEIMADIEEALEGERSFGMSFVRSRCTSMAVNVYTMIQNLKRLAPGKHAGLEERFNDIRQRIDRILTREKPISDERFIIPLDRVDKDLADVVGGKMANLGELVENTDIKAPAGFAITARAYRRFLDHNGLQPEIDRRIQAADLNHMETLYKLSSEIQQLIIRSRAPEDLSAALSDAWRRLEDDHGGPITAAMRSSAIGEDAAGGCFAGQYRSELNVSRENILRAYKHILASKYSLHAIAYRLNKGFRDEDITMCVGCMVMVDAAAGGVIYSQNPVDPNDRSIFINAAIGLPKSVVDGGGACDLFVVSRDASQEIIREDIQVKTQKFVCYPEEGVCRMDLTGDAGSSPAIQRRHAIRLARKALAIERFYGEPQDIEWAMEADGTIFILQCRPLIQSETPHAGAPVEKPSANGKTVLLRGGVTASAGADAGPVYLVDKGFDVLHFPEGAVLVARQALPRWASLLNRAAAVVTEQGGFAGHLANVAREFKVPALFGVQGAVAALPPGEMVTVDASGLAVYRGEAAALLARKAPRKSIMADSPVHRALVEASRFMIPLNLLDPGSAD
ncbi:MAG: pyruvate, water dikinase, partial [Desulfobacterales bacterium]|nr:pyruvate, water dikinase [Desulfobacterales bacterium]